MARRQRLRFTGGIYRVTFKGDGRRDIFHGAQDYERLAPRSWDHRDPEVLERLRTAFPDKGEYIVYPKPHLSGANRVDIKLRGGQWWTLAYFRDSGNIGIIDPFAAKRTFILKDSEPGMFYVTLTNEIMRTSRIVADLHVKIRSREEGESLGSKSVYWYM